MSILLKLAGVTAIWSGFGMMVAIGVSLKNDYAPWADQLVDVFIAVFTFSVIVLLLLGTIAVFKYKV